MSDSSNRLEAERGAKSIRPHRDWIQYQVEGKLFDENSSLEILKKSKKYDGSGSRIVTLAELKTHTSENDIWIAHNGIVYDISNYLFFHPGGKKILLSYGGKDATNAIKKTHSWVNVHSLLLSCMVGSLEKEETSFNTNSTSSM